MGKQHAKDSKDRKDKWRIRGRQNISKDGYSTQQKKERKSSTENEEERTRVKESKERTERKVGERKPRCRNVRRTLLEPSPPGSDLKEEEGNEEEDEER